MNIKMIVTDLDGTLLHANKELSQRTIQTLQKCQSRGIVTAIATARYWIGAENYIKALRPDYEITTDGTLIHRADKIIYGCGFDLTVTNRILQRILAVNRNAEITTAVGKKVYWNSPHIAESKRLYKAVYHDYQQSLPEAAYKIAANLPSRETAESIAGEAGCKVIAYRQENLYGFINRSAGKLPAIRSLCERLGIPLSETAAFGDDVNDVDMLKACGLGVAVANAIPSVQEAADEITLSNEKDGVADFIEREIL